MTAPGLLRLQQTEGQKFQVPQGRLHDQEKHSHCPPVFLWRPQMTFPGNFGGNQPCCGSRAMAVLRGPWAKQMFITRCSKNNFRTQSIVAYEARLRSVCRAAPIAESRSRRSVRGETIRGALGGEIPEFVFSGRRIIVSLGVVTTQTVL